MTAINQRNVIRSFLFQFEYLGSTHYINVPFNIVWEDGSDPIRQKSLDNPGNMQGIALRLGMGSPMTSFDA